MKPSPSWPQVALLAVLLTSVILAHAFAPAAASAVVSIVSTVVGAFFVDLKRGQSEQEPSNVVPLFPPKGGDRDKEDA